MQRAHTMPRGDRRSLAIGSRRLDPGVEDKGDRRGVEVKTSRDSDKRADPADAGVDQRDEHLARIGTTQGWLVRIDQRAR
jgi:hypothetical protein